VNKSYQSEGMIKTPSRREHGYSFIENFQPYNRVITEVVLPLKILKANDTLSLLCKLYNPATYAIHYNSAGEFRPVLSYTIRAEDGSFYQEHIPVKEYEAGDIAGNTYVDFAFTYIAPEKPGRYSLYIVYWLPVAGQLGTAKPAVFIVR
jgi:hypothetical protein